MTVSEDLSCALAVEVKISGVTSAIKTVQAVLRDSQGRILKQEDDLQIALTEKEKEIVHWQFRKDEVKLWWPTGYGKQTLYEVEVILLGEVGDPLVDRLT